MKGTYAWENGAVWCVNQGLETYYWSCRSFTFSFLLKKKKKKKKKMTNTRFSEFLYTKRTGVVATLG